MPGSPDIYEKELKVQEKHLDKQEHVNNVQYVQWVQDVAEEHWERRSSPEQQQKYIWVVVRHEIDYKKEAFLDEDILLQTYVGEATHVTSIRYVNILNGSTGDVLAKAKTTWCLLDAKTKRPSRISEELKNVFIS